MRLPDVERFIADAVTDPEGRLAFRGALPPDYTLGINVDRSELKIDSVIEVHTSPAGASSRMTRGMLKMLESSSGQSEHTDLLAALKKELNREQEILDIATIYRFNSAEMNGEIASPNFSWTMRNYSELEWSRREILS
jgi:hypothetical protein